MNENTISQDREGGFSRSAWVVFAGVFTVLGLLRLLRWTQGSGHWEDLLPYGALLIMALAHVFQLKGMARWISQAIFGVALIIVAVMLIIR